MSEASTTLRGNGMSRRLFLASAVGAVASPSLLSGGTAKATSAPSRVLRFSDHEPLGGMRTRFLKEVAFPTIERESNGRLKIEDRWDGEIAKAYDALGTVSKGEATDMATVVPEYTAKELPLHQIFKSFLTGPTGGGQIEFFQRVYAEVPAFLAELEKNDIVPLFFGTGYPVAFFSTEPMADLDGIKGRRWRSASFWHLDFLRNAGATPVTMHWGPEIYEAMKQKTLDGLMVNIDSGYMLNVHSVAPNVLVSKDLWLGHLYILAMNKRVWDELASEDKNAIRRAERASYGTISAVMDKSFDAQLEDLRKAGATVRVLDAEEPKRWEAVTRYRDVQTAWAQEQTGKGITDAVPVLEAVRSIMDDIKN